MISVNLNSHVVIQLNKVTLAALLAYLESITLLKSLNLSHLRFPGFCLTFMITRKFCSADYLSNTVDFLLIRLCDVENTTVG